MSLEKPIRYEFHISATRPMRLPMQFLSPDGQQLNVPLANGHTVTVPRPADTEWCDIHGGLREKGTPCMYCEPSVNSRYDILTNDLGLNGVEPDFRVTERRRLNTFCALCGVRYELGEKHLYGCGKQTGLDALEAREG